MKDLASQDLVFERQMWPRDEAIEFFGKRGEPLKVQLIEEKTAGQPQVSVYTIKDRDTFVDFCVGPHVPVDRQAESVQADDDVERLLEGRREEPADAAGVRHGVLLAEGARRASDAARRGQETRPSQGRQGARPLHVSSVGAGRDVLARQGHDSVQRARQLHARRAHPGRLRRGEGADHLQQGVVGDVRALGLLPGEHVPGEVGRRRRDEPEADELPGPFPALRHREAQLQGSAAALSRADAAPSQRSLGRVVGADESAPVLAGRWPLLRHRTADRV